MRNQMMCVKINEDLSIRIGHKTKLGRVDEVLAYGNLLREQRGLRVISMNDILRKSEFWEFVIARNTQNYKEKSKSQNGEFPFWNNTANSNKTQSVNTTLSQNIRIDSDYSILEQYKDNKGRIKYNELIKEFPHLIKSQRGGKVENRGYWLDLYLLLKIGAMLDKDLEVAIYDVFIKGKILEYRDAGGENFKKLNSAIDTLPDRQPHLKPKGNKGVYIQVAKLIRDKLRILDTRGYNQEDHDAIVQQKRDKIEDTAVSLIKMKMINSYPQLKTFIINFPI